MDEKQRDLLKRKALFVPCASKAHLYVWIKEYLGIDVPDTKVDPESTSTPMDTIWEIYSAANAKEQNEKKSYLAYASRDGFKTLGAAILEVLAVVHLQRDVAHMAAQLAQAKKAQSYVKSFFHKPYLRDYVVSENATRVEIRRYYNDQTGENLSVDQFKQLDMGAQLKYKEISNYITVVVCTMAGANSEHVNFFVVDELDVIENPKAYEEAKMIPAPRDGKLPITFYTSTRKFSYGLVQKEIDNAQKSELKIRHWNIIDVTEKCPSERHRPDLPMVDVYYSNHELTTVTPEEYETFSSERKEKFNPDKAYAGCVKNCKMFAMCRGRLATAQKERDAKSKADYLLKPIAHTQNQFSNVSVEHGKAQLLCWKPSTEGLIYPNFDRDIHMLTPAQMAEFITGEEHREDMTKLQLIDLLKTREVRFAAGMDFGYTHNFSVALGAIEGNRCFVLDVLSQAELEIEQQVELCNETIKHYAPKIYADPENPQAIVTFRKRGYRITKVEKGKGSVIGGIELVRQVLKPATGRPRLFFLQGDPGCEFLAKRLSGYHWKTSAAGEISNIPDDADDDECDALRYLVMSTLGKNGKLTISREKPGATPQEEIKSQQDWMSKAIRDSVGNGPADTAEPVAGKKGGFFWNLG